MRNIFRTFRENKKLLEENKILKAQNDALTEFRKNFDNYYKEISGVKIITRSYNNEVVLNAALILDEENNYYRTADMCKEVIARKIVEQLMPLIEFDIVDNNAYGTKNLVGRLHVLMK